MNKIIKGVVGTIFMGVGAAAFITGCKKVADVTLDINNDVDKIKNIPIFIVTSAKDAAEHVEEAAKSVSDNS